MAFLYKERDFTGVEKGLIEFELWLENSNSLLLGVELRLKPAKNVKS